jgi:hypothetical protein
MKHTGSHLRNVLNKERVMARTYDSWLTDYDGWLEKQPPAEYHIRYDSDEKLYMVFENSIYLESFKSELDAETYVEYLGGVVA